MALSPTFLLIVSVAITSVTSATLHFKSKLDWSENTKIGTQNDVKGVKTKLEEYLVKSMEDFRKKMTSPQPDLSLPTLDPFSAGNFEVNINRIDQIELFGNTTDVTIEGLSTFQLTRLKIYVAQTKGKIRVTVPHLKIRSRYDLNGSTSKIRIPIYGRGGAELTLHDVSLEASPHFIIGEKGLGISELNLDWNPAAWLEVSLDGLYCTSSELSTVVGRVFSDLTPRLLRNYKPILLKYADNILFHSINALLAKLSLDDIIGLIP